MFFSLFCFIYFCLPFSVISSEDTNYVKSRNKRSTNKPLYHTFYSGESFDLHDIHDYNEITRFLNLLQQDDYRYVRSESVGTTSEYRNIQGIKISSSLAEFGMEKDVFWVDGGIHAREWNSPATVLVLIKKVLDTMKYEPTSSVASTDWIFVPVMNPDGYIYSLSNGNDTRLWRKNRSKCPARLRNSALSGSCFNEQCCGVDLNRNFDDKRRIRNPWPCGKCSDIYSGVDANEPETESLISSLSKITRLRAYLSIHESGQQWMYPYARKNNTYPKNIDDLRAISYEIVDEIRNKNDRVYKVGTPPEVLRYKATGTSVDWAADHGVEYPFTVELTPAFPFWFAARGEGLPEAADDMWIAIQKIAKRMIK